MAEISSDLLLDLYGCINQPERWNHLLDSLCSSLHVRSAVVQILDREHLKLREQWCARDTYSTRYAAVHDFHVNNDDNPRLDLTISVLPQGDYVWRHLDEHCSQRLEFQELQIRLARIGLGRSICIGFEFEKDRFLSLILHKAAGDGTPFSASDVCFLRNLGPHVEQMTRVTSFVQNTMALKTVGRSVLDHMRVGVIVCDSDRRIEWLNRAARTILDASPHLADHGGLLRCLSRTEDKHLAALVAVALQSPAQSAGTVLLLGRHSTAPAQISVAPVEPDDVDQRHTARRRRNVVLFLSLQEDGHSFDPREIAALFALSPAESALTAALSNGLTLQEYAHDRGISAGTARVQLKHALAKTGTNRQAELVRRVNSSVLGFRFER